MVILQKNESSFDELQKQIYLLEKLIQGPKQRQISKIDDVQIKLNEIT